MINKIYGSSITQNINSKNKKNEPSFGVAYHLDNASWFKTFDKPVEQDFISKAIKEIKSSRVTYLGSDGINYKFKTPNGEFSYVKESKGLMSNLKFVPSDSRDQGFYIIDNATSVEMSKKYKSLTDVFDSLIQKSRRSMANYYNPSDIRPNFQYGNSGASNYLRDTTPKGLRNLEVQNRAQRTVWPSEYNSSKKTVIVRMGDMAR